MPAPDDASPVSLDRINEITGGDREFAIELIDTFIERADELVETIARSAAAEDFETLRIAAHTLKDSSSNFDATALQEASAHLEAVASTDTSFESLESDVELIRNTYAAARKALEDSRSA